MNASIVSNNRDAKLKNKDGQTGLGVIEIGNFQPPALSDAITVTYPSNSVEVYAYRQGGLTGVILKTVTVTYTDSSKKDLLSVEVV
jgi:hypothetical protein